MKKSATILVSGGAGYIGSHTVWYLNQLGYRTIVFDNLSTGFRQDMLGDVNRIGDLQNPWDLKRLFLQEPIDAVIHFAANIAVGESVKEPLKYYRNNTVSLVNLLETMQASGVKKLVFSSTAAVYGNPVLCPISEDAPIAPVNPYGHSKAWGEQMLRDCASAYGMDFVALRYFNACGKAPATHLGEKHDPETHLIPLVLDAVAGRRPPLKVFGNDYNTLDGTCIRDYVHVLDLAQAHELALQKMGDGGSFSAFNLGNGQGHSVLEVIRAVEEICQKPVPFEFAARREGDPAVLVASSAKAKEKLGWKPKFESLQSIIKTLVQ
ncbi:MAG: UDP-glucose 4-epimerase GalE [Candidatus Cloacimonetes bacterium]|nr:UDP-glucose 4-epimerase GalE [Candidatus Cloacimonadota bacterium]